MKKIFNTLRMYFLQLMVEDYLKFKGCASFEIINNKISTSLFLQECVILGKDFRNPKNK